MTDLVISARQLTKYYGRRRGLAGLDLSVQRGEVYGFLGPNGAGKTTTIRLLLDLIRPDGGELRLLGGDPRRDGVTLRQRIGYLPGDFAVPGRQTGRELLTYLSNLRGGGSASRIKELADRLELDVDVRVHSLSKGNRQKLALVQAFMHQPELLILDEPTAGLDPLVQQTFLAIVREARDAGQSVLMSSHVMSEVQHSADRVGIIRDGRMVAVEQVEQLRDRAVRRVEVHFGAPVEPSEFTGLTGVTEVVVEGNVLRCRLDGLADALVKAVARHTVISLVSQEPDLEELFLTYYRGHPDHDPPENTDAG